MNLLKYKNFVLKKDDYCWMLIQNVEYDKQDGLHGEKTGEKGIKEKLIGYYPIYGLDIALERMLDHSLPEDINDIQSYIESYRKERQLLIKELNEYCTPNKEN